MNRFVAIAGLMLLLTSAMARAEDPVPVTDILAKALAVDPAQQKFLRLANAGAKTKLLLDRNAFVSQTGIDFLSRYLPEMLKLDFSHEKGVYKISSGAELHPYTSRTASTESEHGTTQGRDYSLYASMHDGFAGDGTFAFQLPDLNYHTDDWQTDIHADKILLMLRKNQRFFGPTSYQLGWEVTGFNETHSIDHQQVSRLRGGQTYNILVGAGQNNKMISDLWEGKPVRDVLLGRDGDDMQKQLDQARYVQLDYALGDFAYESKSLAYAIGKLSLKYQSQICGGCRGRFDIGFDRATITKPAQWVWLDSIWPDRSYASGNIEGIEFGRLIASRDALLNPFDGRLFSCPNFGGLKSFFIPEFNFSAYDESTDFSGRGSISVEYKGRYTVNGRIEIKLKKGSQKIDYFLSKTPKDGKAAKLGELVKAAFLDGEDQPDGSTDFVVVIKDNALTVNGTSVAADADLSDLIPGTSSICRSSPSAG